MTGDVGVAGTLVLITTWVGVDAALDVPAAFVSVTVMLLSPEGSGLVGVNDHVPSPATLVEPIAVPLSYTVIVSPAVPVPLMCGVESAVVPPAGITWPLSSVKAGAAGVAGVTTPEPTCTFTGTAEAP